MDVYLPEAIWFMFVASIVLLSIYFIGYFEMRARVNRNQKNRVKALFPDVVYSFCESCNNPSIESCSACVKTFREKLDHISDIDGGLEA